MATPAELRARVARSVDRVAAEEIEIIPMRTGGGYVVAGPDPDVPAFRLRAVVSETSRRVGREGEGATGVGNITVRAVSFRAAIALAELAGKPEILTHWRVRLLDPCRAGTPDLAISNFEPASASHGRRILHITKA